MAPFPARLHVLLARQAPIGIIIRRGPSNSVASILWNREDDSFTLGQWLKGRIYERRSDLSPNGKFLIYFAMNGRWQSETKGSWTAISKAPYLKALALFSKGDCWNGGGLWTSNKQYWLNDGYGHTPMQTSSVVSRDTAFTPTENYGGECLGVYFPKLIRDGWTLIKRTETGKWRAQFLFEKPLRSGWILQKIAHAEVGAPVGKGCYWDEHALVHPETGNEIHFNEWEWADIDGKRLVWAAQGKLHTGKLTAKGLSNQKVLFDANAMQFEAIKAPY
jgi:hypothetical protein